MGNGYRILAEDCQMSNDTWKTKINNNDIIIGPSGAGKTRGYVIPNILQCNESMIVADTKGNLKNQLGGVLEREGFRVISIDFTDCFSSEYGYNPFDYIRYDEKRECFSEQDISTVATCMVPIENSKDAFWELSARMYLESLIAYMLECLPEEEYSLASVVRLFKEMETGCFEKLMHELREINPDSFAVNCYDLYRSTAKAEKMYESIRGILAEKLSVMSCGGGKALFHNPNRMHLKELGRQKTAVFLTVSDTDRSMDSLVNLFYTQAFHTLCYHADRDYKDYRLEIPVRIILDDFATNVYIPDFDKIISVIRSREIYVSVILQSISQLEGLYGHARAMTILNNCDSCLYLGGQDVETARYMSIKANKSINSILEMGLDDVWLFTRGKKPRQVTKYDVSTHEKYNDNEREESL